MVSYAGPATLIAPDPVAYPEREHTEVAVTADLTSDGASWSGTVEATESLYEVFDRNETVRLELPGGQSSNCKLATMDDAAHPEVVTITGHDAPPFGT